MLLLMANSDQVVKKKKLVETILGELNLVGMVCHDIILIHYITEAQNSRKNSQFYSIRPYFHNSANIGDQFFK